jgi:hypothetical protein
MTDLTPETLAEAMLAHQRIPTYRSIDGDPTGPGEQVCTCGHMPASDGPNSPRHVAHVAEVVHGLVLDALADAQTKASEWEATANRYAAQFEAEYERAERERAEREKAEAMHAASAQSARDFWRRVEAEKARADEWVRKYTEADTARADAEARAVKAEQERSALTEKTGPSKEGEPIEHVKEVDRTPRLTDQPVDLLVALQESIDAAKKAYPMKGSDRG